MQTSLDENPFKLVTAEKKLLLPNACEIHNNRESGVNEKYILTQILSKQSSTSN